MYQYKRFNINLDEDKIKEKYIPKIKNMCNKCNKSCKSNDIDADIACIKEKWNTQRNDWSQGFDSDCFAHCCRCDLCFEIFKDKDCHKDGHLTSVIVEFENPVSGFEEPIDN